MISLVLLAASIVSIGLPNEGLRGNKILGTKIFDLDKLAINLKLKVFVNELSKSYDFLRRHPRILLPILLLGGQNDVLVPAEAVKELDEAIGTSIFTLVPYAGHLNLLDEDSLRLITNFLKP